MVLAARITTVISIGALLAACGGGGDSGTTLSANTNPSTTPSASGTGTGASGGSAIPPASPVMPAAPATPTTPATPANPAAPADPTTNSPSAGAPSGTPSSDPIGNANNGASNEPESTAGPRGFVYDATARFNTPGAITTTPTGEIYVADQGGQTIRRISATGDVTTLAGTFTGGPLDVVADRSGNVFVLSGSTPRIDRLSPGGEVSLVKQYQRVPGAYTPVALEADSQGRLYVIEQYRELYNIVRIDPDNSQRIVYSFNLVGSAILKGFASDGSGNLAIGLYYPTSTPGGAAEYRNGIRYVPVSSQAPVGPYTGITTRDVALNDYANMAFDVLGNLYVTDVRYTENNGQGYVSEPRLLRISADGNVVQLLSTFPDGSTTARPAPINARTFGVATGYLDRRVFIADPLAHAIYAVDAVGRVSGVAGRAGEAGSFD